jgi:hypothetical protein
MEMLMSDDWFFGPPPLVAGDDPDAYRELLKRVTQTVQPADMFEQIWIRDVVDLTWEVLRWRRAKAKLVKVTDTERLQHLDKTRVMLTRMEQVDQLIGCAEARRNIAYHELKHHRGTFAALLCSNMKQIEASAANENSPKAAAELIASDENSPDIAEEASVADDSSVDEAGQEAEVVEEISSDEADQEAEVAEEISSDEADQEAEVAEELSSEEADQEAELSEEISSDEADQEAEVAEEISSDDPEQEAEQHTGTDG